MKNSKDKSPESQLGKLNMEEAQALQSQLNGIGTLLERMDDERVVKFNIESIFKTESEEMDELIQSMYVSPDEVSKDEDAILKIKSENDYSVTSTLGNILTIVGKPKSRKTIFLSLLIASLIKGNLKNDTFKVKVPENRKRILVFDTEQSKACARLTYSRINGIVKGENISNILVFSLREYSPSERLKYIERIVNNYNDAFLIVIDGIRDLIPDINNAVDATTLTSKLMKWSAEKNLHIINVIHQNKIDNNARGHLGTELVNKSESVITVVRKDDKISIVKPVNMRDLDFKPFAFGVNEDGVPYLIDNWNEESKKEAKKRLEPESFDLSIHTAVLKEVFKDGMVNGYKELVYLLKKAWIIHGNSFGENKLRTFISFYTDNRLINKLGGSKSSRYTLV